MRPTRPLTCPSLLSFELSFPRSFSCSFSAPLLAGHPKGEWVPAREAKGCFLRRRQKSRRVDFWRNHKRAARRSRSRSPPCRSARRNASQLAVPDRTGQKKTTRKRQFKIQTRTKDRVSQPCCSI